MGKNTYLLYLFISSIYEKHFRTYKLRSSWDRGQPQMTLYCWVLSKEVSSTIFRDFGMTRPGIEPGSPGPLANTLPNRPKSRLLIRICIDIYMYWYIYMCVYWFIYVLIYICIALYIYIYWYIYICIDLYMYWYLCIDLYMYWYIYIYIYIVTWYKIFIPRREFIFRTC